jgi:hypothetical protein
MNEYAKGQASKLKSLATSEQLNPSGNRFHDPQERRD